MCGAALGDGISVEYWQADQRIYHTWCHDCGWTGDIIRVTQNDRLRGRRRWRMTADEISLAIG